MLEAKLKQYFSFTTFRSGQKEIIESILAGKDTVAIMPTGAGKSLCFQFPALVFSNLTVVISPLIALMKNQVDSLTALGIEATFINSSLDLEEQRQRYKELLAGKYKLLYLAPERLANGNFFKAFTRLKIDFLAIDEAHCISAWGHDFRPEYQQIASYISLLPKLPVIGAFTATATSLVCQDIQGRLRLKSPQVFVRGFDRPNLKLFVRNKISIRQRRAETLRLVKSMEGNGIIYTLTIKEAEDITAYLVDNGVKAVAYHAKLEQKKRTQIQDEFMENEYKVVVATVAFGMGIDKADIRFVIHVGMPPNLERYYQEAGRAGRDGEIAYCILLHNGRDKGTHHFFIQKSIEQMQEQGKIREEIKQQVNLKYEQLEAIENYVTTTGCRRKVILEYFGDPQVKTMSKCKTCDNCLNYKWQSTSLSPKFSSRKKGRKEFWAKKRSDLSGTVLTTVQLYESHHNPDQIAKIRGLGHTTIMSHLAQWLASGGNFDISLFVTEKQEKIIEEVVKKIGAEKLSPIKEVLPATISYDQIKLVVAKMSREVKS